MTGAELLTYIKYGFKRTDKDTELYSAIGDTIREIRRKLIHSEDEEETTLTDTISAVGDYQLDLESDTNLFIADVVILDGNDSWPLIKKSKGWFDEHYPNPDASNVPTGKPRYYCVLNKKIRLGPAPDKTSYTFKITQTKEDFTDIVSGTADVPFTPELKELIKFGTLARIWVDLDRIDRATAYGRLFESSLKDAEMVEDNQKGSAEYVENVDVC